LACDILYTYSLLLRLEVLLLLFKLRKEVTTFPVKLLCRKLSILELL
jgi:hypothetical protein